MWIKDEIMIFAVKFFHLDASETKFFWVTKPQVYSMYGLNCVESLLGLRNIYF